MLTKHLASLLITLTVLAAPPAKPRSVLQRLHALEEQLSEVQTLLVEAHARLDALESTRQPPPKQPAGNGAHEAKPRRCEATATSTGKRCRAQCMVGSRFCMWHDEHGPTINPFNPD